jgi:hypothetical protein
MESVAPLLSENTAPTNVRLPAVSVLLLSVKLVPPPTEKNSQVPIHRQYAAECERRCEPGIAGDRQVSPVFTVAAGASEPTNASGQFN